MLVAISWQFKRMQCSDLSSDISHIYSSVWSVWHSTLVDASHFSDTSIIPAVSHSPSEHSDGRVSHN